MKGVTIGTMGLEVLKMVPLMLNIMVGLRNPFERSLLIRGMGPLRCFGAIGYCGTQGKVEEFLRHIRTGVA